MYREQQPNQVAYYLDANVSLHGFGKIERWQRNPLGCRAITLAASMPRALRCNAVQYSDAGVGEVGHLDTSAAASTASASRGWLNPSSARE